MLLISHSQKQYTSSSKRRYPPAEPQLSEAMSWNNYELQNSNRKHDTFSNSHENSAEVTMNNEFVEARTFSDSNDSVLDNSTDGEGSIHKEVFIDYQRSLTRKGSNSHGQK